MSANQFTIKTNDLAIKLIAMLVLTVSFVFTNMNLFLGFNLLILILFVDYDKISLRNYYMVYTCSMFGLAGVYYHLIFYVVFVYYATFLAGYWFYKQIARKRTNFFVQKDRLAEIRFIKKIIYGLVIIKLIAIGLNVYQLGIANYFSGAKLVANIAQYNEQGVVIAITKIATLLSQYALVAAIIAYLNLCWLSNKVFDRGIIFFVLLVLPLLALSRGMLAVNLILLFFLFWGFVNKKKLNLAKCVVVLALIISIAAFIGQIRQSYQNGAQLSFSRPLTVASRMFFGEFSTLTMYDYITKYTQKHDFQYGKTILLPLLFKPVPHNLMLDKPKNTSALVMGYFRPDEAQHGLYLAPSIFGDLYANGGVLLVIFGLFILGVIASRFDREQFVSGKPIFGMLLLFYMFYSVMRSNIPQTIIEIVIVVCFSYSYRIIFNNFLQKKVWRDEK